MFSSSAGCSNCASISERAQLINDLIRNQHEVVTSLLSERRVSSSARQIATQLRQQNEHLSSECTKISEEYKSALEKLTPLETRVTELENEVSAKAAELEKVRHDLSLAHLAANSALSSTQKSDTLDRDKTIRELEDKLKEQKAKASRDGVKKRRCTTRMKDLLRLKGTLGSTVADRMIGELAGLLDVALRPDEVEALELEKQLMAQDSKPQTSPSQQGAESIQEQLAARATCSDCCTQTASRSVASCHSQTSPPAVAAKEVQVRLSEEKRSPQIEDQNDPASSKRDVDVTLTESAPQSKRDRAERPLLNAQVTQPNDKPTSTHNEFHDRLRLMDESSPSVNSPSGAQRTLSSGDPIYTRDQEVQASCILVNAGTCPSPSRTQQQSPIREVVQRDREVQATRTILDAAISTSPCRVQEQQRPAHDTGTSMSPSRLSQQTCANCCDKAQGSQTQLVSDSVSLENDESEVETKDIAECDGIERGPGTSNELAQNETTRSPKSAQSTALPSLLDCIPSIEIDEDGEDPVSPPQGALVPRKNEKRVSFVDQEVTGPAHDSSEESDERVMRELEMIIEEMRHPFANRETIRELSPLPPSPVPPSSHSTKRKKKRHRDKEQGVNEAEFDQRPRKRLAHQNSTGFDPVLSSTAYRPPSSSTWAQEERASPSIDPASSGDAHNSVGRLKAEVAHIAESGVTTFSFQIPSGGSSRFSIDFDQTTRQLQLSCQTPKAKMDSAIVGGHPSEDRAMSATKDMVQPREIARRPSLGFAVPSDGGESRRRSPDGISHRRRSSAGGYEGTGGVETYPQEASRLAVQLRTQSHGSELALQAARREDSVDDIVFEQRGDHIQTNVSQYEESREPAEVATGSSADTGKLMARPPVPVRYPSILKSDRRLKRLSKHKKNKGDLLVKDMHKGKLASSMSKSILEAKEKMMQRRTSVDRKGFVDSDSENGNTEPHVQFQSSHVESSSSAHQQRETSECPSSTLETIKEDLTNEVNSETEIIDDSRGVNSDLDNSEIEEHPEICLDGGGIATCTEAANADDVDAVPTNLASIDQSLDESVDEVAETISALSDAIVSSVESQSCEPVDIIDGIVDPPPRWVLQDVNGKLYQSPVKESDPSDSESEKEMCIAVEPDDTTFTPMSPEHTEVADRGLAKLIPIEFDENMAEFVYGSIESRLSRAKRSETMPPPPASPIQSPPPASTIQSPPSSASMTTRRMAKVIPSSPLQEAPKATPRRVSPRISVKQGKLAPKPIELLQPINLDASTFASTSEAKRVDDKATVCPKKADPNMVNSRPVTRNGVKVSLLKDSYVAEKEDYGSNKLFGYDDTTISATSLRLGTSTLADARSSDEDASAHKVDKMSMLAGFFKQNEGRFPRIESLLKGVADDESSMDAAVASLMNENQVRKIYVSLVYVLIENNSRLSGDEQQVSRQERNLIEFLLRKMPAIKKYEGKTNHAIALSCVNFIRAYLMSPAGCTRCVLELSSLLKTLTLVAQEAPSERRQLLDEMYYFMADRTDEAAYLICCYLAAWPESLSQVEVDSPLGFVLRYVLYHHPSTVPLEELQRGRAAALRSGWKPLPPTGTSLAEAIERFTPVVFERCSESGEISRLALHALELLLTIQGDPGQARVVLEGNVPRLLAAEAGSSQWEVHSLLQLCGKVWKKFSSHNVAQVMFESTVKGLLALIERLGPDKAETKEFCCKALWSYVGYDKDSEWSSRAKQHCMKQLTKAKRNKLFTKQNDKKYNNNNDTKYKTKNKKKNNMNNNNKRKRANSQQHQTSAGVTNISTVDSKRTRNKGRQTQAKVVKVGSG